MALDPSEIFKIPEEAIEIVRSQLKAGDLLMVMRSGVAPLKIKITETGLLNKITIGETTGEIIEGDKKIVNGEEFTYINGAWVS